MDDPTLAPAAYWATLLENIADIAFFIVILALAVELGTGRVAKHFRAKIDAATELEIAQLRKDAADANLARVRLEARLAPRTLTSEQQDAIFKAIQDFHSTKIDIFLFGETTEIIGLANKIAVPLSNAGWEPRTWSCVGGGAVNGLLVIFRKGSIVDAAVALVRALNQEGIDTALSGQAFDDPAPPSPMINGPTWDAAKASPVRLFIGTKPQ